MAVVAGPFGSLHTMTPILRLVYWGLVVVFGLILATLVRAAFLTFLTGRRPRWRDLGIALVTAIGLAPIVYVLRASLDPVLRLVDLSLVSIWVNTLIFVAPVFFISRKLGHETPTATDAPPQPRLARRLPEAMQGAAVLRLSGSGHTVEVMTERGPETLRLRLSDAIDEMDPVEGYCTHRSHWVARAAVAGLERREGKLYLRLVNGERVPVTRTYAPKLEAAGVIPPQQGQGT